MWHSCGIHMSVAVSAGLFHSTVTEKILSSDTSISSAVFGCESKTQQAVDVKLWRIQRSSLDRRMNRWSCGDIYIRKTDRCMTHRVSEYITRWLPRSMARSCVKSKSPASQIAEQLVALGYKIELIQSFNAFLHNTNLTLLAMFSSRLQPEICATDEVDHE